MSEQTIRVSRSLDVPAAMPWLVAIAVYLLLMVLGNRLLGDADTYWHITLGRLILEHRALPTGEALSQTVHATHWVAYEWLSQIAYAAAYALGGWVAVAALTAAAAAAAFGLLTRYLLKYWQPTPTIAAVLAALVLTSPHIMARPHVLALPLMVTWIAALIRAVDTARPPSWWLIPLMTLWANLHGSFIFGLAMTGVIAGEAIWLAPAPQRRRAATDWIAFAALALGAACVNPYGPELIAGDDPHPVARPGAVAHRRMAAARFQQARRLRDGRAGGNWPGAMARRTLAAVPHPHAARRAALQSGAVAARRSARHAGAAVSGAAAGDAIRRARREPTRPLRRAIALAMAARRGRAIGRSPPRPSPAPAPPATASRPPPPSRRRTRSRRSPASRADRSSTITPWAAISILSASRPSSTAAPSFMAKPSWCATTAP